MVDQKTDYGEFVSTFLKAVLNFSKEFAQLFARESFYYKDLRIGGYDPDKIYRSLNNLRRRGILQRTGKGCFKFTKTGTDWAQKSAEKYFELKRAPWDKKWRVVIFDIPQELHKVRIKFRKKLKNLGFYMLQKSVFIFPYECEEELGNMCQYLKISDYVDVLLAERPGFKEDELLKFYSLFPVRTKRK